MAVTGSFRQQCPSCEALILVKDAKQIGKKMDCPNCKFRFVVEEPAAAKDEKPEEAAAEEAPAKGKKAPSSTAVTSQKPAAVPTPAAPKKKAGPKKPIDYDDDEDEEELPKKAKSSNMVVILGVGLAGGALLVLCVGGYYLFIAGKEENNSVRFNTRPQMVRPPTLVATKKETIGPKEVKLVEVTNVLPADTQGVLNLNVKDVVNGVIGRAALDTPGAFKAKFAMQRFGLPFNQIDRLVAGRNWTNGWWFAVVRTGKEIDLEEFKKTAGLQVPADSPYQGQEYFLTEPSTWLDYVSATLASRQIQDVKPRQLALRVLDSQTLVVTDSVELLKKFLDEKGQPKQRKAGGKGPGGQPASNRYLTVSPQLKEMLDQLETKPQLFTLAVEADAVRAELGPVVTSLLGALVPADDPALAGLASPRILGLALETKDQTALTCGLEFKDHDPARVLYELFRARTDAFAKAHVPGSINLPGLPPAIVELDGKIVVSPAPPPALSPLSPTPAPAPAPAPAKITMRSQFQNNTVLLSAAIVLNAQSHNLEIQRRLGPIMIGLRGMLDMAVPQPRVHDLGAAVAAMAKKEGKFPRGTFLRPIDKERRGRPYEPDDRVSWMADLLPYLEMADVRKQIKTDKSWRDPANEAVAACLVPAFLDSSSPASTWLVRSPSMRNRLLATTQFAGMAGVGLDAAEYSAMDNSVAKKLGIFGYDRETKLADIKDGPANTIALIQMPAVYRRPWLAGGGATVIGVPEKDSIKPFVCAEYEVNGAKAPGTFAIMADGAVRFIPATISDAAFQALCTIAGGEPVDLDRETVLLPPPVTELKTKE